MPYVYLVLLVVLSVLGFWIGRSRIVWRIRARLGLVGLWFVPLFVIGLWGFFRFYPEVEFRWVPDWLALPLEIIWLTPFAIFFLVSAANLVGSKIVRQYLLIILVVLLFVLGLNHTSWVISDGGIDPDKFKMDKHGIALQSTGFSCGPACAVTLLAYWGIPATEKEMARLVHCSRYGTIGVALARGIKKKALLHGFNVDIKKGDWDDLVRLKHPCIAFIKFGLVFDHVIVILEVKGDKVVIGDPLVGKIVWSKEKFLQEWRNVVITMQPAG